MLQFIKKLTDSIPLWVYNLLALLSSLITIATAVWGGFACAKLQNTNDIQAAVDNYIKFVVAGLICIIIILGSKLIKYRKLSRSRMTSVSHGIHRLTHLFRDTFFDVLHDYKKGALNVSLLSKQVTTCLEGGLDSLCEIMQDFTGHKVSACIKLIESSDQPGEININTAKIRVLCRSENSDPKRKSYDNSPERAEMFLKDDTALRSIIEGVDGQQDHFYCSDLDQYEKDLKKTGKQYRCPTSLRSNYYNGTMVLPIRILFKRLYHMKREDSYHIIGFLCVDSLSRDAFRPDQETQNCEVGNAFADEFYAILSKYRHYLNKLEHPDEAMREKQIQFLEFMGLSDMSLEDFLNVVSCIKSEGGNNQ